MAASRSREDAEHLLDVAADVSDVDPREGLDAGRATRCVERASSMLEC